jgi:hypothetical protein
MDTTFDELVVRFKRSVLRIAEACGVNDILWDAALSAIMKALEPFEEARIAVAAALTAVCG